MRLAAVTVDGRRRTGALVGDGSALALLPEALGTVDDLVRGGPAALQAAQAAVAAVAATAGVAAGVGAAAGTGVDGGFEAAGGSGAEVVPVEAVRLEAPLQRFNRDILCTGWNYLDHFEESRGKRGGQDPADLPTRPTFFTKGPDTVIGPADDIAYDPALSEQWDYEAEIAVVIGRDGRSIPEEEALGHVFGFLIANDVSQRDLQRAHGGQWLKGKSIDATMPLGPWLTTVDEVPDPGALRVQCEINGDLRQDAVSAQMAFPFARLIAELSRGMTLRAGDVLLTGTPSGIGSARDPQLFLRDGDLVVTRVSGLGELRNRVVATALV